MSLGRLKKCGLQTRLLTLVAVSLAAVSTTYAARYIVTPLISPAPYYSDAVSINSSGSVTGHMTPNPPNPFNPFSSVKSMGYVYKNHSTVTLTAPDGISNTSGLAINGAGQVAGIAPVNGNQHAILWTNGVPQDLGFLSGTNGSYPYGINDLGAVVGYSGSYPFVWQNGVMTSVGSATGMAYSINNFGDVVGMSNNLPVLWDSSGNATNLSAVAGIAYDINDTRQVVGRYLSGGTYRGFLWQDGILQTLPLPAGSTLAFPYSINSSGVMVGGGAFSQNIDLAVLWENSLVYDLNTLIPLDSGWVLKSASDINAAGQIVGYGTYNGKTQGFLLNPAAAAPVTQAAVSGTVGCGGWYTSPVSVTLTATGTGIKEIHYSLDGEADVVVGDVTAIVPVSGAAAHNIRYFAVDYSGNVETPNNLTVNIDGALPSSAASVSGTAGTNGWYKSPVTLQISGTDATSGVGSIKYRKSVNGIWGSTITGGNPSFVSFGNFSSGGDGRYAVGFNAVDRACNAEAEKFVDINIDSTPPVSTYQPSILPNAKGWYTGDVSATFSAIDNLSGVATLTVNGAVVPGAIASYLLSAEGLQTLNYYATDFAGVTEASRSVTLGIDKTPPTTSYSTSSNANSNGWFNNSVTVNFSAIDNLSGVDFLTINGSNFTGSIASSIIGEGIATLIYSATDKAGLAESQKSTVIRVDKTAPAVTLSTSPATLVASSKSKLVPVIINGSASDSLSGIASVQITITDEYGSYSMTVPTFGSSVMLDTRKIRNDADGRLYTVQATATDVAGNQQTSVYNLWVK